MTEENAIIAAATAAKEFNRPAYVYYIADNQWGSISGRDWEVIKRRIGYEDTISHIVLPGGAIYNYQRQAP